MPEDPRRSSPGAAGAHRRNAEEPVLDLLSALNDTAGVIASLLAMALSVKSYRAKRKPTAEDDD
ncbi:hypothetical protein GCM10027200_63150 [Lentzea nigeriaca]